MKKLISVLLVALLALTILPLSVMAQEDVIDVTTFSEWKVYSDGNASAVIRKANYPDAFQNKKWVNSSGITAQIAIDFGAEGLVMENLTVGPGIVFEIRPPHGAPVTIKNCTFRTARKNPNDDYRYTLTIMGGHVTLTNNVFENVYRGLNLRPAGTTTDKYSLTATGNTFKLLPIEEQPQDNIGIQLSGDRPWGADSIMVSDNRFENASIALRLHSSFKVASDVSDEKVITFNNNLMYDSLEGIGLHPNTSEANREILQELLENNVEQENNEIDNCFPFEWDSSDSIVDNMKGLINWFKCSLARFVNFFRNVFA